MKIRVLSTAVVAVACLSIAFAQGGGGQGGGQRGGQGGFGQRGMGMGMQGGPQILARQDVQAELKLTDSQKSQIQALLEANRPQGGFGGGRGGGGGGQGFDPEALRAQRERMEAEVQKILTPEQYKRYRELNLQLQGPRALGQPEVAKEVGLSEAQQNQIRQLIQAEQETMRSMFQGGGGGGDFQAMREQMQAMRAETDRKILAVLNAEQKAKWESMLGKKFEFQRGPIR